MLTPKNREILKTITSVKSFNAFIIGGPEWIEISKKKLDNRIFNFYWYGKSISESDGCEVCSFKEIKGYLVEKDPLMKKYFDIGFWKKDKDLGIELLVKFLKDKS